MTQDKMGYLVVGADNLYSTFITTVVIIVVLGG